MKILMVCLGNICRSPLAEGIAKQLITEDGLDWHVDSAGTSGWHNGEPPDARAIEVASNFGIDISGQQSRQLMTEDFEVFDAIIAMDAQNYQDIKKLGSTDHHSKVFMMMNFAYPDQNRPVPDPYYGGPEAFENVYRQLEKACTAMIEQFK